MPSTLRIAFPAPHTATTCRDGGIQTRDARRGPVKAAVPDRTGRAPESPSFHPRRTLPPAAADSGTDQMMSAASGDSDSLRGTHTSKRVVGAPPMRFGSEFWPRSAHVENAGNSYCVAAFPPGSLNLVKRTSSLAPLLPSSGPLTIRWRSPVYGSSPFSRCAHASACRASSGASQSQPVCLRLNHTYESTF